jgi:Calcium-activated BK potassium channel alpha subunit
MMLIVLVILYIPYQTNQILDLYKNLSKYQRAQHSADLNRPHIILSGSLNYSSIIDFCREYFVADTLSTVVILSAVEPDIDIRRFLNHPFYRNRLTYLRGSIMSPPDLKRASATHATALFLVNIKAGKSKDEDEEIRQTRTQDAELLMHSLIAKHTCPGLPVFAQVQDTRSKDLSNHCGCDRVLCIEEIQASIYAANCVVPGLQALIPNLIHSYQEMEDSTLTDFWMKEYQYGIANQIHSFKIPNGFVGIRFKDFVQEIFSTYSTIVFGLVSANQGFNQNPIRISINGSYRLKSDDVAICITEGGEETVVRISLHYKTVSGKLAQLGHLELESEMNLAAEPSTSKPIIEPVMLEDVSFEQSCSIGSLPPDIHSHIILCGNLNTRTIRHFVMALRSRQSNFDSNRGNFPVVCILESLPDVENLGVWTDILSYGGVFVCQGTAMKKTTLMRAKIAKCSHLVMLSENISETKDAVTVFMVKMMQQEWPHVKFLVELIDGSNVKFFNGKNISWDTDNLRMQSIINNYALSVHDRMELYRKVRNEGLEKNSFFYQLIRLVWGEPDQKQSNSPKKKSRLTSTKKEIKKSYTSEASDPLVDKSDEVVEEASAEPEEKSGMVTESHMQKLLEEAELNELGLTPYPMYHFDR